MSLRNPFMIASGGFFFRYRQYMFPLFFMRPQIIVNQTVHQLVIWAGFIIALLGQSIRLFNIGLDYIERGGKDGKVYASRLVTGGIYNHVRNPMYLGNLLMAVGIGLYSCVPLLFVTALPFFFYFYYAIMASEENFLRGKFGEEYEEFCRRVNRLWPRFKNITKTLVGFTYNWRRAAEKDSNTAFWTFTALIVLPLWRNYHLYGRDAIQPYLPYAASMMVVLFPFFVTLRILKKKGTFVKA